MRVGGRGGGGRVESGGEKVEGWMRVRTLQRTYTHIVEFHREYLQSVRTMTFIVHFDL